MVAKLTEDDAIKAIIESLEKDEFLLSDGFGYYAGSTDEDYYRTMRKVARHILVALNKLCQGEGKP